MRHKKILRLIGHLLIILVLVGLPFIFFAEDKKFNPNWVLNSPFYWLFALSFILLFYLNYYFLVPRFYLKKKYVQFGLILGVLFCGFYLVKPFLLLFRHYLNQRGSNPEPYSVLSVDIMALVLFVIIVALGLAMQVVKQWRVSERKFLQIEAEKAQSELSFLKAQVNPHFLYNTLNNIYSQAIDQDPETPDSILKLSNLMRFISDEATRDCVPLEDEITCIQDYIDLQQLRLGGNIKVDFTVTGTPHRFLIAPLILITYIENAFKYGISSHQNCEIIIRINAEPAAITFYCQNCIFDRAKLTDQDGIGLQNARQRLNHLYPDRYKLNTNSEDGQYKVNLILKPRTIL